MRKLIGWVGMLLLAGCSYTAPGDVACEDGATDGNRECVGGFWVTSGADMDTDACTATVTCASAQAECGSLDDGCGVMLDCGTCPMGQQCGTETDNICGEICEPATCASAGANCGEIDPGCNQDPIDCGECTEPETCGAVTANQCGCVPDTCETLGFNCGAPDDGCGTALDCGMCTTPETCGGEGQDFICGCTSTQTCESQNVACGMYTDECGDVVTCDAGCFEKVSAGEKHTCAINAAGAVFCWGENSNGQLGDGSLTDRDTPTAVQGLDTGWVDVSVGNAHSCALSNMGEVRCWGNNRDGQLAMDTATTQLDAPTAIAVTNVSILESGPKSTCVVEGTDTLKCWGDNSFRQLSVAGDPIITPTEISITGTQINAVAVGTLHSCVLVDSTGYCWGENNAGQLGNGTASPSSSSPTELNTAEVFTDIAVGLYQSCAINGTGALFCWGSEGYGNDNSPRGAERRSPSAIAGGTGSLGVSSFFTSVSSARTDGFQALGRNDFGQLGDGTTTDTAVPVTVTSTNALIEIDQGHQHGCYIDSERELYCWGRNDTDQLANPAAGATSLVPVKVFP